MVTVSYAAGDRLRIETRGHVTYTDQPVADGGEDSAPTPTELFVASLGACVAFYAQRFLRRSGLPAEGLEVTCEYRWAENPHRVGEIDVNVHAPGLTEARRDAFERVVERCTVHNSLLQPPRVRLSVGAARVAAA